MKTLQAHWTYSTDLRGKVQICRLWFICASKRHKRVKLERRTERINLPLWKCILWSDAYLVFLSGDGNSVAQDTCLPRDLDTILQKLLKRSDVHDLVFHRFPTVDGEGLRLLLPLGTSGGLLGRYRGRHYCKTELLNSWSEGER